MKFFDKIQRKLLHLRLQPIRVFCFHQVSNEFDESYMHRVDWLQTDVFKSEIKNLQKQGYIFISLSEAFHRLQNDNFRLCKYAVLTADDGWASLRNILPWLNEQQIPVTLFLNPAYWDGKHFREKETERYLTSNEVEMLYDKYPLLTIGSHGWKHIDIKSQDIDELNNNILHCIAELGKMPNYIPFYAYPFGRHNRMGNSILKANGHIPVYLYGNMNYNNSNFIDRELLK